MESLEFKNLQDSFKVWLKSDANKLTDDNRYDAVIKLTQLLNASGLSSKFADVEAGSFLECGTYISCGPNDSYGNRRWEIMVWEDQFVEVTTYDENLGGLVDGAVGLSLDKVVNNPSLLIKDLEVFVKSYNDNVKWAISEGRYDFNAIN